MIDHPAVYRLLTLGDPADMRGMSVDVIHRAGFGQSEVMSRLGGRESIPVPLPGRRSS